MAERSGPPDVRPDQHGLDLGPLGKHRPDGGPAGEHERDERRERTYRWEDPAISGDAVRTLASTDFQPTGTNWG